VTLVGDLPDERASIREQWSIPCCIVCISVSNRRSIFRICFLRFCASSELRHQADTAIYHPRTQPLKQPASVFAQVSIASLCRKSICVFRCMQLDFLNRRYHLGDECMRNFVYNRFSTKLFMLDYVFLAQPKLKAISDKRIVAKISICKDNAHADFSIVSSRIFRFLYDKTLSHSELTVNSRYEGEARQIQRKPFSA